jgi:ABC-type cobalamin/Fe3+-siderophores transport system ATPase subunit
MSAVSLRGVRKSFGSTEVVHGVDIAIADGEFCVLVGPSGCGKSTLLPMIAGLEEISAGEITIGARVVKTLKIMLPLAVPGLISAGIFTFTLSWNEFIYALTFISSSETKTVSVAVITELVEGDIYHWGSLMAGALLGSVPVAVLYSFFVEYYVSGMTGAVKE